MNNITKAVNVIGGQTKTGALLGGLKQSYVWDWMNKNGQAPAKYIKKISALTNNEVTVEQLLADHEKNHEEKNDNGAAA